MSWNYKREESGFESDITPGKHRLRILSAEKAVSKRSGNDMLVIRFEVSGFKAHLWHYISFLPDRPEVTNRMLTSLFDSFGIPEGNFNLAEYPGYAGAAMVKLDEDDRPKISYFLSKEKQAELPPWKGDASGELHSVDELINDDDIPF